MKNGYKNRETLLKENEELKKLVKRLQEQLEKQQTSGPMSPEKKDKVLTMFSVIEDML